MFKRFGKMRLGRRIGSGFGVIILMAAVLGYIGWNGVGNMHSYMSEYAHWVEISAVISEEVNQNAMKIAAAAETYTSSPHEANKVAFGEALENTLKAFEKWSKLIAGIPQLEKVLLTLREDVSRIDTAFARYRKVLESNKGVGLMEAEQGLKASVNPLSATLENVMKDVIRPAKEEKIKAAAALQRGVALLSIVVATAVVVVGVLLSFLIVRAVTKPINRAIGELFEGAGQVSSSASQLASASQHVAEGSSQQAASIEETSSSLEEMASMTKQNADHAAQADSLMKESKRTVGQARDSMNDLTKSMAGISKASQETSKIIKTIDEIAFQTNLLALNAAVEAARAGEAGAGFAVVAGEVRNLALRAAEAAKNTAQLIEETVKNVKDGAQLVSKTNEAFAAVAAGVTRVGELVGEISAASGEQAQGIDQVNRAVAGMDKVVQEIAASAEESASASQQMNSQAERTKGMVSELRVLIQGTSRMESDVGLKARLSQKATTPEPGNRPQKPAMGRKKSEVKEMVHAPAVKWLPQKRSSP